MAIVSWRGGGQPRGFSNNRIIGCAFALDRVRPFESIGLVSNARRRMKSRLADFRGKIFLFHCILRYLNCYKGEGLRDLLEFKDYVWIFVEMEYFILLHILFRLRIVEWTNNSN